MAKKQKRKTSTGTVRQQPVAVKSPAPASSRTTVTDFNPDYSDVKKDLKRIGMLAGSFFVILIILSFILR